MPVIHVQRAREQTARRPGAMDGSGGTCVAGAQGVLADGLSCAPLPQAPCSRIVKLPRLNAATIHVGHPAKPHAKGRKPQPHPIAVVVQAVMVVPMKRLAHTQAARQFINGLKAMRVGAGRLVRHQNIGAL